VVVLAIVYVRAQNGWQAARRATGRATVQQREPCCGVMRRSVNRRAVARARCGGVERGGEGHAQLHSKCINQPEGGAVHNARVGQAVKAVLHAPGCGVTQRYVVASTRGRLRRQNVWHKANPRGGRCVRVVNVRNRVYSA